MGQNNITVKHLRQQRFLLSRNSYQVHAILQCVLCEVILQEQQTIDSSTQKRNMKHSKFANLGAWIHESAATLFWMNTWGFP